MFFDETTLAPRKRSQLRILPPTPNTGWLPPKDYPNLSNVVALGFDFEVKEDDFDHGPGWSRGKASIVGAGIDALWSNGHSKSWYFPFRHEVEPEYNLDPKHTLAFLKDVLELPIPKFGANLIYDCGNALDEGINVKGDLHDCQFSEALLNEAGLVDLKYLSQKYLGEGKESSLLYQWCADAYGGEPNSGQRENIYRASPRLAGPYGETDARNPRLIVMQQWAQLHKESLAHIYRMECDLIPLWVRMRKKGVRVNVVGAEQMYVKLTPRIAARYKQIHEMTGVHAISTKGGDIEKIFKALNIDPPMTEKGNPSFAKEYLLNLDHEIADVILDIRKLEILQDTFLKSYIINGNVNGIVHCEFLPLRGDEGGTRVGRLSSSHPNLQNIPVRTEEGKEIRKLFLPFEGHVAWEKQDFSQIQYRALVHYAVGQGSDEARKRYNENPDTDYHDYVQAMILELAKMTVERRPVKNLNFGLAFGQGKRKTIRILGKGGEQVYNAYHQSMPFVKQTLAATGNEIQQLGYVTSLLGRRNRFDMWEPAEYGEHVPLPYNQAIRVYGANIKRSGSHRGIAVRLQGTEADIMKSAMLRAYKEGVYDVIGDPTLTVHDENGHSVIDYSPRQNEAYTYLKCIMENTLTMRVPIMVDAKRGPTWGDID